LEKTRDEQARTERDAEVSRLITESQDLFAQWKSAEAIQLLRKAHELDKNNPLARSILANALVEHAQSVVETDWLEAEKLTNQALNLNPAHPTAKTILSQIVTRKETSSVQDWISQARKLRTAGDMFAALAWVAEGLAVHPHDPKLLQMQDEIQRDQDARRRQARRGDLEDLQRLHREIDGVTDVAAKQALAVRIQTLAARHWTDGEILSIANALLLRLGLGPQESSSAVPRGKSAAVILHVPRPSVSNLSADTSQIASSEAPPSKVPTSASQPDAAPVTVAPAPAPAAALEPPPPPPQPSAADVAQEAAEQSMRSNLTSLIVVAAATAIIAVGATLFFARKHYAQPVAEHTAPAAAPAQPVPAQPAPETSSPASSLAAAGGNPLPEPLTPAVQRPTEAGHEEGTLLVVAGQDDAKVFLNGKLQRQLTQAGQLRIPNLDLKDYVVQVSKTGFQDPPQQQIRIRKGEPARLVFNLIPQPQPQPRVSALTIQGGVPGTTVLLDQTLVGTIQPDGTLSVSTVNPGDHSVELRKEGFKTRQFRKQFVAGGTIALATADAALETAPGELTITFAPSDAKVALVKGELLKMVSSGAPLNLPAGTYTLTVRTADKFTRSSTVEVFAGQSRTLDLSLGPSGMSKWEDPGAWKQEKDSFVRKGGDFVLYDVVPASGTFVLSAMPAKGHLLRWVLNYTDPKNYILFQMDDSTFSRAVIRNGQKTAEIKVPSQADKKSYRALHIRVTPTELVHEVKDGDRWTVIDHFTLPGVNLALGKFGFYIPGNDEVSLSAFAHYADLNTR